MLKLIVLVFISSLMLTVISCQREVSFETPTSGATGALKMKINGVQWVANKGAGASMIGGYINITGLSSDRKTLNIFLADTLLGIHVLDQNSLNVSIVTDSTDLNGESFSTNAGRDSSDAGGVVVVTSFDKTRKTISGTFRFKMFRDIDSKKISITEGVFENLSYESALPPASSQDTFYVSIDNTKWTGKSITAVILSGSLYINATELNASKTVGLVMPADITPGTYDLDALGGVYVGLYNSTFTNSLIADSGKLTILQHNIPGKRIRGNFNFKAVNLFTKETAMLTAGYFSIKYP